MSNPTPLDFSPFKARLAKVAAFLHEKELSHLLVTSPVDVGYLTGYSGGDSYLLVGGGGGGKPVIVSDFRYQEELAPFKPLADIVIRTTSMVEAVGDILASVKAKKTGIQAEYMTVADRDAIAKRVEKGALASTTGVVMSMRRIKDEHEVSLISKAIKIQEQALLEVLPTIEVGQTEAALAGRIETAMKDKGATGFSFGTIVAAKANGSLPHYRPGSTKVAANQGLLIDWGAQYRGYRGDLTRTFAMGKWPKKVAEIYAIVLEAHEAAAAALAAGKSSTAIDKVARDVITKAGYGEQFGHGLGHGIGLDTHEDPRMSHMLKGTTMQAGNVVTIEPGIYLPGVGGVRIEDDYLVTEGGCRKLSNLPKTLEWATLG
jgi:Xaa-Pro aminopeptidase